MSSSKDCIILSRKTCHFLVLIEYDACMRKSFNHLKLVGLLLIMLISHESEQILDAETVGSQVHILYPCKKLQAAVKNARSMRRSPGPSLFSHTAKMSSKSLQKQSAMIFKWYYFLLIIVVAASSIRVIIEK